MVSKNYPTIDIAKFFFSLCILFLHTGAYHEIPCSWYFLHLLLRLAVPFFFVVSGYFLGTKLWQDSGQSIRIHIKQYINRLLYPYIVFSVINSIMHGIDMYSNGESFLWTLLRLARAAIFYPYGALWYVWASIIASILLYWFIQKDKMPSALLLGIIGYMFALLCNSYYSLIEGTPAQRPIDIYLKITTSARNGLFVGFLLLGIGIWLARFGLKLFEQKTVYTAAISLAISFVTLFFEVTYIKDKTVADDHSLFISQLILIPALIILLLNFRSIQNSPKILLLRKLSTGFYFIHRPVLSILLNTLRALGYGNISRIAVFFILTAICLAICLSVYKYKPKYIYHLL